MTESTYWTRMRRRTMSRRAVLGASARAGVGAAGLALVGCGDDDDDQSVAQSQQTQQQQVAQAQADAQAQQTATQQAQTTQEAMEEQSVGLLPGELSAEDEARSMTAEEEWRLRFHWSKLQNLPGQADGPKNGGTWRLAHAAPANWNVLGPNASLMAAFAPMFYSQLVVFPMDDFSNAHYYLNEGDLAEGWEIPDPTTVVFQLRPGIKWQNKPPVDGRDMTAEDVKIAYDALREPERVQASSYTAVKDIAFDNASNTVRFNLTEPAAYLLNNMMNPFHVVVAPEFVEEPSMLDLSENQVGTGPFTLDSATTGSEWRGSAHPEYFKKDPRTGMQLPYLESIHGLDFVNQRESEWAAWETGETDWIRLQDITEYERAIESYPDMVVQVTAPPPGWQPHMTFKDLNEAPFNDPRVRQALSLGMDRDEQAAGVYYGLAAGGYGQNWTFFKDDNSPWGFREWPWTFEELGDFHVFNAAEGRALLDAAGFNEDNPLSFQAAFHTVPGFYLDHFLLIVDQWQRNLGAQVEHEQIEWESWLALLFTKEYSGTLFTWLVGSEMDADGLAYGRMNSESPGNIYGINDPDIDVWTQEQRQELDVEKRSDILEKIRIRELENMWRIFAVNPYRMAARRSYLFNQMDTYNAWNPGWGATNTERIWKNL